MTSSIWMVNMLKKGQVSAVGDEVEVEICEVPAISFVAFYPLCSFVLVLKQKSIKCTWMGSLFCVLMHIHMTNSNPCRFLCPRIKRTKRKWSFIGLLGRY